jgi:hypothetical protein
MSMELHVFLPGPTVPAASAWQEAIDRMSLPVELPLSIGAASGFVPTNLEDVQSGFELSCETVADFVEAYPRMRSEIAGRDTVLSFRWGGDLRECACACAAAAALVEGFGAVVYDPQDGSIHRRAEELAAAARDCLHAIREMTKK